MSFGLARPVPISLVQFIIILESFFSSRVCLDQLNPAGQIWPPVYSRCPASLTVSLILIVPLRGVVVKRSVRLSERQTMLKLVFFLLVAASAASEALVLQPPENQWVLDGQEEVKLLCKSSEPINTCTWITPYNISYTLSPGLVAEKGRLKHFVTDEDKVGSRYYFILTPIVQLCPTITDPVPFLRNVES